MGSQPMNRDNDKCDLDRDAHHHDLVAICGLALRLPGCINSPQEFWSFLLQGGDARGPIPITRYNAAAFLDPLSRPGTATVDAGYFLSHIDLEGFDLGAFSMTRAEVAQLDPVQRQLLEIVRECLESAGETAWKGKDIGCFVGTFGEDWADLRAKDSQDYGIYRMTGASDFVASNRISYEYDFRGPSVTFRTACSASLIALHSACQALRQSDCSGAIVAAANLVLSPTNTSGLAEVGTLSPEASCKTFDASADGYARGEAVNAIYVKRLSDALAAGNPIRAVIRSTASNSDGRSTSFTHPNGIAHESLIRGAYRSADFDVADTAFVELHGTGTPVGDPIEAGAVARIFGGRGVYIGSVKPNVGHSEGASGLTSIIKAVLALENKTIPPNIKFKTPNPKIPFREAKLEVPTSPTPWPMDRLERVSVNSFGLGGTNAHVILDSAASFGVPQHDSDVMEVRHYSMKKLLVLSAYHPESVVQMVTGLESFISRQKPNMADLSYTLARRRDHLPFRSFCIADDDGILDMAAKPIKANESPQLIFVFTGQGAQYPEMGKLLAETYPSFDNDLRRFDAVLAELPEPPTWSIRDTILQPLPGPIKGIISQPLCIAIQIGLVNLLHGFGITPTIVVGHSSGEIAAAYASGALSAADAVKLSYRRGQSLPSASEDGGMAAVGLGRAEVQKYLRPGVTIGCENSPSSVTLSGTRKVLEEILVQLREERPQTFAKALQVDMAYHSHHMYEVSDIYAQSLGDLKCRSLQIQMYSTTYGRKLKDEDMLDASYWCKNLVQPVLFDTAIREVLSDPISPGLKVFLEIGPHSALRGSLRQCFQRYAPGDQPAYVASLIRNKPADLCLLNMLGNLYSHGVSMSFDLMFPFGRVLSNLPPYAWHRDKVSGERHLANSWKNRKFTRHELLGNQVIENNELEPAWRNVFRLKDVPWISDHRVEANIIFPGAGYVAIAGEAVRQASGGFTAGYDVRNVSIQTAMILRENVDTEIMTTLKPVRLTDSQISSWYDFTISSFHNGTWLQHCWGQVRTCEESLNPSGRVPCIESFPRWVSSQRLYQTMERSGFHYGPSFTKLNNVSAAVGQCSASATIPHDSPRGAEYTLHPVMIDAVFQTLIVANAQGKYTNMSGLFVPTYLSELGVRTSSSQILIQVDVETSGKEGSINGSVIGSVGGEIILKGKGLQMSQLNNTASEENSADIVSGAQLEWMPSLNFLDLEQLFHAAYDVSEVQKNMELIALLAMRKHSEFLKLKKGKQEHLEKYRLWLVSTVQMLEIDQHPVWPDIFVCGQGVGSYDEQINSLRQAIRDNDPSGTADRAVGAIVRVADNLPDIVENEASTLELLSEDGVLSHFYQFGELFDYRPFFQCLTHERPTCNILEIGAGTGSTTVRVLPLLYSRSGERMFSTYVFTDISESFLSLARSRFQEQHPAVTYQAFDITQDPSEHGIPTEFFDVVIANNVVHTTSSLAATLSNIHKVLRPNGFLLLQELCSAAFFTSFVMGGLEGWWVGDSDHRVSKPYVHPERWDKELKRAGFSGADLVMFDHQHHSSVSCSINALMVARPVQYDASEVSKGIRRVTLVVNPTPSDLVQQVATSFRNQQIEVDICQLDQVEMASFRQDVVFLLDIDAPFVFGVDEWQLKQLTRFLTKSDTHQRLLWVTQMSQLSGPSQNPHYAPILGLARNIRFELGLDFSTLELDLLNSPSVVKELPSFYHKYRQKEAGESSSLDYEYALVDGIVSIGRFHWYSMSSALTHRPNRSPTGSKLLDIGKKGFLQSLYWKEEEEQPLSENSVTVKILAVGLNFRDVMIAMGVISAGKLGIEAAGTIARVGSAVKNFAIGDPVVVLRIGCFGTKVNVKEHQCIRIPDGLGYNDAATMYAVYCTSILALMEIGRVRKGQTVLIHSACGGLGLSAIQLCQSIGAEVFATVGSDFKAKYLRERFSIPTDHIFDSHNAQFREKLLAKTGNRGVDIVLNSLAGELLHASWDCVAEFGIMIELGKRDIQGRAKLDMSNFSHNRGYYGVDYEQILDAQPEMNRSLMSKVTELYEQGKISPISPLKEFAAAEIEQCFRYLQKGEHIGKMVVCMPDDLSTMHSRAPSERKPTGFDQNATYLLIGGLGGLGRHVAVWMAERGAKNLTFLSRSKNSQAAFRAYESFFNELAALGCSFQVLQGDITAAGVVEHVIATVKRTIRGVLQMAMELNDNNISDMTYQEWSATVAPKIQGTLHVHEAFSGPDIPPLDFFVMFSSQNGLYGWYGQSNYAAGNAFQDAFVAFRHRQGLAASVLDIGPVEDIGFLGERPSVAARMRSTFRYFLPEEKLLEALELAIATGSKPGAEDATLVSEMTQGVKSISGHVIPGMRPSIRSLETQRGGQSVSDAGNGNYPWLRDSRFLIYRNIEVDRLSAKSNDPVSASASSSDSALSLLLSSCSRDPSILQRDPLPIISLSSSTLDGGKTALAILIDSIFAKVCAFLDLSDEQRAELQSRDVPSLSLSAVGVDSLVAIELRNWWRQRFGLEMSVFQLLENDSIGGLGLVALEGLRGKFPIAAE